MKNFLTLIQQVSALQIQRLLRKIVHGDWDANEVNAVPARRHLFLLTLAMLALLTFPRILKVGMFFDGVTFASIARNLAEGKGTFWAPYYTETVYPSFLEYLPLGFWLQSWVYRLFGDHVTLDPIWDLGMGVLIVLLLVPMWRLTCRNDQSSVGAWWPVLLFVSVPMTAKTL
ncbi:MAG: hypothetical protein ACE5MM_06770, partial [Nitrospiraceae bacterium]